MIRRAVHGIVELGTGPADTAVARGRFRADPGRWLPPPATPTDNGHRVHLAMPGRSPEVAAIVSVGVPSTSTRDVVVRAVTWRAATARDLFPVLQADLELHTGHDPTLRLVGAYIPPLSVLGALTDHVLGRHVVTGVVNAFLIDTVGRLVPCPAHPATRDVPS